MVEEACRWPAMSKEVVRRRRMAHAPSISARGEQDSLTQALCVTHALLFRPSDFVARIAGGRTPSNGGGVVPCSPKHSV